MRLRSSDASLPKAYGLPKIHKENLSFRIIVSSINTALYKIGSLLQKIISDCVPKPSSHVNNSFELYRRLSGLKLASSESVFSLDVVSLFTNIPLNLALDSINNRWVNIEPHTKIKKPDFLKMVEFVLGSTYFTFNSYIYKQTFGILMGSPLSPIIANVVMGNLENSIIQSLDFELKIYLRYVDDIMIVAPNDKISFIQAI